MDELNHKSIPKMEESTTYADNKPIFDVLETEENFAEPNEVYVKGEPIDISINEEPVKVKDEPIDVCNKEEPMEVFVKEELLTCNDCEFSATSAEELEEHKATHLEEKYACNVCTFRTKHALILMRHMKKHSALEQFKCDKCTYTCSLETDLQLHIKVHIGYSCKLCKFTCDSYKELLQHGETHLLQCEHCDYKAAYKISIIRHHAKSHKVAKAQNNKNDYCKHDVKCKLCPFKSYNKPEFYAHIKSHCVGEVPSCHICDYVCLHNKDLRRHLSTVHNVIKIMQYKCDYCSYKTIYRSLMFSHLTNIHKKTLIVCGKCNFKCNSRYGLFKHTKEEHPVLGYLKCNLCSYETSSISLLFKHKLIHNQGYYKCEVCNWKTLRLPSLKTHLSSVHKIKVAREKFQYVKAKYYLPCKLCNFKGISKHGLSKHMMYVHEKPLKCANCSFRCKQMQTLIEHMKYAHSEYSPNTSTNSKENISTESVFKEKMFACNFCNYKGLFKEVKSHTRKHYNKLVKCNLCSAMLHGTRSYIRHKAVHDIHGNGPKSCDLCHYIGKNYFDLKLHKRIHRKSNRLYCCYYCDYKKTDRIVLLGHVQSVHKDQLKNRDTNN